MYAQEMAFNEVNRQWKEWNSNKLGQRFGQFFCNSPIADKLKTPSDLFYMTDDNVAYLEAKDLLFWYYTNKAKEDA
jgi:hypothetical protein